MTLKSGFYTGWLQHRRHQPKTNHFRYPLFMTLLDLEELPLVFAQSRLWSMEGRNLLSFRRKDYHGPVNQPLADAVRATIRKQLGWSPNGSIRLLTHLRFLGYCFNPVSFYYCFDDDNELQVILAEITNTPWGERHSYVLPVTEASTRENLLQWSFDKQFHVSPFIDMERQYHWRMSEPADRLLVHMNVHRPAPLHDREFDATLTLERQTINAKTLRRLAWRFPAITMQVLLKSHIQAAKLWFKRVPFFAHPEKR